jgi:hypothetical protein
MIEIGTLVPEPAPQALSLPAASISNSATTHVPIAR